jgi:hypothetical protein
MNAINHAETAAGLGIFEDGVSARIEITVFIKVTRIDHFIRMPMQTQEYLEDFLSYIVLTF